MTKKILALLFILCSAANLPASECIIVDQNEIITASENNTTYALLIGMHKNNALTAENLSLLTKTQSVESILEILTTQKEDLQSKVDAEKLYRAATSMFNRVGKKWAGLLIAPFSSAQTCGFIYHCVLYPINKSSWTLFKNLPLEEQTYTKIFTETINQTVKNTWEEKVSKAPNWTNKQLKFGMQCTALTIGTLIALNYAQQLYQYYTHIRNYEKEINRIDAIIETINALHIA
jgi:hypothetical protein